MSSNQHRLQIPIYDPDTDAISPKAWINLVDLGKQAAGKNEAGNENWTDEITASHAILLLRGKAASWISNLIEDKDDSIKKWSSLKEKFRHRFCEKHTLSEKTKLISDLSMSSSESVNDFFDRCKSHLMILYDEEWPLLVDDANDKAARQKSINLHHKVLFSAGLRSNIKADVIIQDSKSLEDVKTVAMRVEASVRDAKPKQQVAEINTAAVEQVAQPIEDPPRGQNEAEVDAVYRPPQRRQTYQPQNFNRRGRGARGGRSGQNQRFNGSCHYCHKFGHRITQCFTKENDEKRGIFRQKVPQPNSSTSNSVQVNALDLSEYLNTFQA